MPYWKRLLVFLGISLLVLIIVYVAFFFVFLDIVVDFWWFRSLEDEGYFWLRLLYRYFISGGITLLFFLIFFTNYWVASRYLGTTASSEFVGAGVKRKGFGNWVTKFQTGALDVYTLLSIILAILIALPFYTQWEKGLLFLFGRHSGVSDPFYNNDISFYLFNFPIYQLIQQELLICFSILFLSIALLYWIEHRLILKAKKDFPLGLKIHLTSLVVFVFLIVAWGFMLQRFDLLYVDVHEPVFFGPGFVEIRYELPLIWAALIAFLGTAVSAVVLIHSHGSKGKKSFMIFTVCCLVALGLRQIEAVPYVINKFIVQPNPVKAERRFMKNNIEATLAAYGLDKVKTKDFKVSLLPEDDLAEWVNKEHLQNIPVWDRELLDDVYNQLQGLRPYYSFLEVDEDRYEVGGHTRQVNLSARELNIDKLPEEARSWENTHLRYTHGYAAVMTPAAQDGGQPIEWYLRDLNLHSGIGLKIKHPDIYYGLEDYPYAIVPNELKIVDISGTNPQRMKNYAGHGGIPIRSLFRKLLFAVYYRDEKIFFSTNINPKSRILLRRNIVDRVNTLTPFLALDADPYVVVSKENLYWILDAYTISDRYPVSQPSVGKFRAHGYPEEIKFNYIRNSVKIIVDAYDGTVDYYIFDPADPIVQAYNSAYPGFFKSMKDMPPELKSHLRFPRDLFYHQMKVYAKYHQEQPELFYQQAETWEFAKIHSKIVMPYFLTTEIEGCSELEKFILVQPMTPIRRDNLSVVAIGGFLDIANCEKHFSNEIVVYRFGRDIQVDGPAQVSALIDQDPVISEQFTLWDQHGSSVTRGRMVIMPLGDSVLYVQPIYLISTHTRIPELARVIVSMGNEVVMDKSLARAFEGLENKLRIERSQLPVMIPKPKKPEQPVQAEESQKTEKQAPTSEPERGI